MFKDNEKSGGVTVQPVDAAVDKLFSLLLIMPGESIRQRVAVILKKKGEWAYQLVC